MTDDAGRVRAIDFEDYASRMHRLLGLHYGIDGVVLVDACSRTSALVALERYFGGDIAAIEGLQTNTGGTAFQRQVWSALREICPGQTTTYGSLAKRLGIPKAARAVGAANGANPIAIVVPCHRVIGANTSLTGYGGGLARKQWLLAHEGADLPLGERRMIHEAKSMGTSR